ncbi:MAG: hypothetical protein NW241_09630 [Bacteroidia bacterium]|nr:hypothetical protein [Bacteroidia bacterium]
MKARLILPAFAAASLLLAACKPCDDPANPECPNYCADETNPKCPNYDPCTAETPVSADFRIIENGSWGSLQLFDTVYYDTVRSTNLISEALHVHDDWTYTWYIGSETYEGALCGLDYSPAPKGIPVGITLVVEGPPNTACFPDDDGRDTMTRQVVFTSNSFFTSLFHGHLNGNLEDTITLGFRLHPTNPLLTALYNFKRGCSQEYWNKASTSRSLIFNTGSSAKCDYPTGKMVRDPEKTGDFERVRCEYTLTPSGSAPIPMVFEGRRVK